FAEEIYPVRAVAPNASVRFEKCRLKREMFRRHLIFRVILRRNAVGAGRTSGVPGGFGGCARQFFRRPRPHRLPWFPAGYFFRAEPWRIRS
ncbi:hypothetical protein Q0P03_14470, partial [Staphylococcus aureus]|nr:hypothetical protein [Staphylococcus aureus]